MMTPPLSESASSESVLSGPALSETASASINALSIDSAVTNETAACISSASASPTRHDWSRDEIQALFDLPFNDLLFRAQSVHRQQFDPNQVQVSTLLSIKTGACPEDCAYCPQSARFDTGLKAERLMAVDKVIEKAKLAKSQGATRFCMGAAWRAPKDKDLHDVATMVREVKALGMEACCTLGMLNRDQAQVLKDAGLDYYNHNLDTSPEYYEKIITTRTYQDRLDTLEHVREVGMKTCCGGIVGMGETQDDRVGMLQALANLPAHPDSVPINQLVQVKGTPLADAALADADKVRGDATNNSNNKAIAIEPLDFVRTIAVARILMPRAMVRLSAGREAMSDEMQALCFLAGANSIFYGEKLLTTGNPDTERDQALFARLGIRSMAIAEESKTVHADILATVMT